MIPEYYNKRGMRFYSCDFPGGQKQLAFIGDDCPVKNAIQISRLRSRYYGK